MTCGRPAAERDSESGALPLRERLRRKAMHSFLNVSL